MPDRQQLTTIAPRTIIRRMRHQLAATCLVTPPSAGEDFRLPGIPEQLPQAADWRERLRRWAEIRRVPHHPELPEIVAGQDSERNVRTMLSIYHLGPHGSLFSGKRVPRDPSASGLDRYEMDLVAVTPRRILVLEVKNWSGRLSIDPDHPGRWVHERRDGSVNRFECLVTHNRSKLVALRQYLAHRGVDLPERRFYQAVLFYNSKLVLDRELQGHPGVILGNDFEALVGPRTSATTAFLFYLIERFAGADKATLVVNEMLDVMTPAQLKAACCAVEALRTWDRIQLRGGRRLQGDLLWLRLRSKRIDAGSIPPESELRLRWRRDDLGFLAVVLGGMAPGVATGDLLQAVSGSSRESHPLYADDCLYFQEVGLARPSVIALSSVDHIRMG